MSQLVNRPEIHLSVRHKKILQHEFGTSQQSVRLSLCYINNSPLAMRIRKRARQLLKNEIAQIDKREPNLKSLTI